MRRLRPTHAQARYEASTLRASLATRPWQVRVSCACTVSCVCVLRVWCCARVCVFAWNVCVRFVRVGGDAARSLLLLVHYSSSCVSQREPLPLAMPPAGAAVVALAGTAVSAAPRLATAPPRERRCAPARASQTSLGAEAPLVQALQATAQALVRQVEVHSGGGVAQQNCRDVDNRARARRSSGPGSLTRRWSGKRCSTRCGVTLGYHPTSASPRTTQLTSAVEHASALEASDAAAAGLRCVIMWVCCCGRVRACV